MKILYINADPGVSVYECKGASVHVRSMAAALVRSGHEVRMVSARAETREPAQTVFPLYPAGIRGVKADGTIEETRLNSAEAGDRVRMAIRRATDNWRPDVIYERYSLWNISGVEAAAELAVPHLLELNAPLPEEAARYRGLSRLDLAGEVARHVFRRTSQVLAVSSALADYAEEKGAAAGRIAIVPNAVDGQLFESPSSSPRDPSRFSLGFCGALRPWHGIADLARIFLEVRTRIPEAHLLVVGDGPERADLEDRIRKSGAEPSLQITGPVDHADVPAWLARMDVALAPYPPLEPFYFSPLKIFEYQAAGLPVVAARQGDIPRYLEHGVTGFHYPPGNIDEAVQAVLTIYGDRELARSVGSSARARILAAHTWDDRAAEVTRRAEALVPPFSRAIS